MKNELSMRRLTHTLAIGAALLITTPAGASTMIYESVGIIGSDEHKMTYQMDSFEITEAGTFQLTLTDFEFPKPFRRLGVVITDATHKYAQIWDEGYMNFEAAAGNYYLGLVYTTRSRWDLGMYGIDISRVNDATGGPAAVPLPASAPLLLSGLAGIGLLQARRKRQA